MITNISIRVDREKREEIDQLASKLDRSRNWVVNEAIKQFLSLHRWQVERIRERLEEAESEQATFVHNGEVIKRQEARLKAKLKI